MAMMPAAMIAPKIIRAPSTPGLATPIETIGPTAAKVTPIITGNLIPNQWVTPKDWIKVTIPQTKRSAEIRKATSCGFELQHAADDQRHGDGAGIHHQNMLQPEREELGDGKHFIDRMGLFRHGSFPFSLGALFFSPSPRRPMGRGPVRAIHPSGGIGAGHAPGRVVAELLKVRRRSPMRSITAKSPGACRGVSTPCQVPR